MEITRINRRDLVNSHDLLTFYISLETSLRLGPLVPLGVVRVSESEVNEYVDGSCGMRVMVGWWWERACFVEKRAAPWTALAVSWDTTMSRISSVHLRSRAELSCRREFMDSN